MPGLGGLLSLSDDVIIVPVAQLPEETRARIECNPEDLAVSRLRGRGGSTIIDPQSAELLTRFRRPRSIIEAVILFAREKQLDPDAVLEDAYPLLRRMVEGRVLVPSGDDTVNGEEALWSAGTALLGGVITRTLQILEDTEVYLVTLADAARSVVKIERSTTPRAGAAVRDRLEHEARVLLSLGGAPAPTLLDRGEIAGRTYLELEFVAGADAASVAAEWREDADGRARLLGLLRAIADAYVQLHRRGWVHGDVHPRNVLVEAAGAVRLIDFGLAQALGDGPQEAAVSERGGIPFLFDPELARAHLDGSRPPPATPASEQYSVAAMLYFLATGSYCQNFRLDRQAMLEDIAAGPVLRFAERGVAPWPSLEAVLLTALTKEPQGRFADMAAFSAALAGVAVPSSRAPTPPSPLRGLEARHLALAALDGPWYVTGLTVPPTTSINYGAAGIALGLLHIARQRGDPGLLATADAWIQRAARDVGTEGAFYNADIQITPETVGRSSPYHSPTGVHAVSALVARARADLPSFAAGIAGFLDAASAPAVGLDLTLGRSSLLLGAAMLLDAFPREVSPSREPLVQFGNRTMAGIWALVDRKPAIPEADIISPGMAHGWAGFLYAALQWCAVSGADPPSGVERRLAELAALAIPTGRGLEWPWTLGGPGEPPTMPGWCNGSCGYVFLWTLAHRLLGDLRYMDLAQGAGWSSWESPEQAGTLCCGLAGRSYALLDLHRHTGDAAWLDRARALALRAARHGTMPSEYPHGLYKGELGLAVLAADLEQPEWARMPFFELTGYQDA